MRHRTWTIAAVMVLYLSLSQSAFATVFVPSGLNPGDTYHLAFITRDSRDAAAVTFTDYNDFVQAQAVLNPALTGTSMGVTYNVVGSGPPVAGPFIDARTNTSVSAPVYLFDDTLLATGFGDLWDSSIGVPLNVTQFGITLASATNVWTGTTAFGFVEFFNTNRLGGANPRFGLSTATNGSWLAVGGVPSIASSQPLPFYAISSLITVPEPTTLALTALGLLGIGWRRRKRA